MIDWSYNKEVEKPTFKAIPVGNYRCRIEEAQEKTSKSNNQMIELVISVSGHKSKLWFYVIFFNDGVDKSGNPLRNITDRNLSAIYESFGIPEGSLNIMEWVGKVGGIKVKHEMKDGETQARVHYFLNKSQQAALPAWVEVGDKSSNVVGKSEDIKWDE